VLQIERHNNILALVEQNNFISIEELMAALQVSRSTIRRDLLDLEITNKLTRTRGGAVSKHDDTAIVPDFEPRKSLHREEKRRIANAALNYIEEKDTILLDEGTTTVELAKLLDRYASLVVATYDLNIVKELGTMDNINLVVSSGAYKVSSNTVIGYFAEKFFSEIHADIFFLAVDAVDPQHGCMCYSMDEILIKKSMIRSAKKTILLVDHSKFETIDFLNVCGINEVNTIITGVEVNPETIAQLKDAGVNVVLV
jgi:DeoR/GlpR family transcriptional regulator of sugar metabolism